MMSLKCPELSSKRVQIWVPDCDKWVKEAPPFVWRRYHGGNSELMFLSALVSIHIT